MVIVVIVVVIGIVSELLVCVAVCMGVVVTSVGVAMVSMVKRHDTDQVDHQPKTADSQQLTKPLHLTTFYQSLNSFVDDLNTNEPAREVSKNHTSLLP